MYWSILPWGDGSFWMENGGNGSDWHLEKKGDGRLQISSNITKPQEGQSFIFKPLGKIGVKAYGSLKGPPNGEVVGESVSVTSLAGFTATSTATMISVPADSSEVEAGLSVAGQAGIGAGVGLLFLIAVLFGGFFLLRRRKRRDVEKLDGAGGSVYDHKYVGQQDYIPVAELAQHPAELGAGQTIKGQKEEQLVELPPNSSGQVQKTTSPVELDSRQLR